MSTLRMWLPRWEPGGHLTLANVLVAAALALLLNATPASAAPGDLDPSFSRDGKRGIGFGTSFSGPGDAAAHDIEQLADGKIVVVGTSGRNIFIARLRGNGSFDTAYSDDGRQVVDPPGEQSWSGASIQPDGSVAVVGEQLPFPRDFAVARIRSDGMLDSSFGGDGVQQIGFGPDFDDGAAAVVIQPDGKVVVGGFAGGGLDFAFARLLQDGELDSAFSADGRAAVEFPEGATLDDMALSDAGEIAAVGSVPAALPPELAVARLRPDGSPDPEFSGDGAESLDADVDLGGLHANWLDRQAVSIQTDGRIVIGGGTEHLDIKTAQSPLLVRLEQDGDLDPSFPVLTRLPVPADVADVAVHPTGILGVGTSVDSQFADFVLFGRQVDGAPDPSFPRRDGSVATNFDARADEASALSMQGDGRVLVAGLVQGRVGIARYLIDQGRRDQDADGFRDKPDRCPRGFSKRRRGCPRLKDDDRLSFNIDRPFVSGSLSSKYLECMDGRRVLTLKRRPGRDRVVRSTKAAFQSDIGAASFHHRFRNLKSGRYYARVRRSRTPAGICRPLRSEIERADV